MAIKATKYIDDTGYEDYKVIQSASLNFIDSIGNSNKFYTAEVHEANGKYRVFTHYGRMGAAGKKDIRETTNLNVAISEFNSLVHKKKKGGYSEIALAQSTTGSDKGQKLVNIDNVSTTNINEVEPSKLDFKVQSLVRNIFHEAGYQFSKLLEGEFASEGSSPLGKLSLEQIEKGRKVINSIAEVLTIDIPNFLDDRLINSLSREYYLHIPKVFGRKIKMEDFLLSDMNKLQQELDTLNFYEDIIKMGSIVYEKDNIDGQYESLNSEIGYLDPSSEKHQQICDYISASASQHHHFKINVENIYSINQKNAPELDDSVGNVVELFHGSRNRNIVGILGSNLKLPNTLQGVQLNGAMFGPGIYLADQSSKSVQYSNARFGGSQNASDKSYLFIVEAALGNIHEVETSHYFLEPPAGYDSVKGVMGSSLLHNEYIVYKEERVRIKYIVEMTTK